MFFFPPDRISLCNRVLDVPDLLCRPGWPQNPPGSKACTTTLSWCGGLLGVSVVAAVFEIGSHCVALTDLELKNFICLWKAGIESVVSVSVPLSKKEAMGLWMTNPS